MTTEVKTKIEEELRRFASDLSLSDEQKSKLRMAFERAEDKMEEIRKSNPDVTRADVIKKLASARDEIREHVVRFLTPQQLTKWDAEISKAKTFLGHQVKA